MNLPLSANIEGPLLLTLAIAETVVAVPAPLALLAKDIHADAVVPIAFVRVRLFVLG